LLGKVIPKDVMPDVLVLPRLQVFQDVKHDLVWLAGSPMQMHDCALVPDGVSIAVASSPGQRQGLLSRGVPKLLVRPLHNVIYVESPDAGPRNSAYLA